MTIKDQIRASALRPNMLTRPHVDHETPNNILALGNHVAIVKTDLKDLLVPT